VGLALLLLATSQVGVGRAENEQRPQAWLGVYSQELTSALREAIDYDGDGVLISKVVDNSPAEHAGLKKGDVIIKVGGRKVTSPADLASAVRSMDVGESATIDIVRDGERESVRVKLSSRNETEDMEAPEAPEPPETPVPPTVPETPKAPEAFDFDGDGNGDFHIQLPDASMGRGRLGVRIQDLNPELGEYFDVPGGKGVLITEVLKDTPAERAGLRSGDVIIAIDDDKVADIDDLMKSLGGKDGRISISVIRKGDERELKAELPKPQPRAMRLRTPMRWNDMHSYRMNSTDKAELKREMKELREELEDLRRDLEELRRK
jgi:serine protease Do